VPESAIDWVVSTPFRKLVESCPHVDRTIVFDRGMLNGPGKFGRLNAFLTELRRERYSLVIDLQGLLRSGLMCLAAKADLKAGFANAREGATFFYGHKAAVPDTEMHAVDRYLLLLESLGIGTGEPEFCIGVAPEDDKAAGALLGECKIGEAVRFVAMAPSARWATKRWSIGNFIGLADMIYERTGLEAVLLGTKEDASLLEDAGREMPAHVHPLFGRTDIMALAAVISRASVLVTNDSGPMHISAALGTPTIAVFGPTSHGRTGPYGKGHRVVRSDEPCAPCFRKQCETLRCLVNVDVDAVFKVAHDALKEG